MLIGPSTAVVAAAALVLAFHQDRMLGEFAAVVLAAVWIYTVYHFRRR